MVTEKDKLLEKCTEVAKNAYCKYSNIKVGATVLGEDGNIYCGVNVENASYGLTVCAERAAIFNMVSAGCTGIAAIAVFCDEGKSCMPCGACRQVISEFAISSNTPVYTLGNDEQKDFTVSQLLPNAFSGGFDEKI